MSSSHREHYESNSIAALHRRHQLEAARSRRYRQRRKNKRQEGADGRVAPTSSRGRLQPGERLIRFGPTCHPGCESSPHCLGPGEDSPPNQFTDHSIITRDILRALRVRQRHTWISFGRLLSYLGCPIVPTQWRCFCRYDGHLPHTVGDGPGRVSSPSGSVGESWAGNNDDDVEEDNEGQVYRGRTRLSVLARVAEMAAVDQHFRREDTRDVVNGRSRRP